MSQFFGLSLQIQLKMARVTAGNTYMGGASFLMTWHLLTPVNCWNTSLLLNPPKSPAFCPAMLWSCKIGRPFNTCGAQVAQRWQCDCRPLSDTLNPMTGDSGQYNTHSSIKVLCLVFFLIMNWYTGCKGHRCGSEWCLVQQWSATHRIILIQSLAVEKKQSKAEGNSWEMKLGPAWQWVQLGCSYLCWSWKGLKETSIILVFCALLWYTFGATER